MNDQKKKNQSVSVLRRKIMEFQHSNQHVMQLMTLILSMVNFSPVDRVDMQEVMAVVVDVQHNG